MKTNLRSNNTFPTLRLINFLGVFAMVFFGSFFFLSKACAQSTPTKKRFATGFYTVTGEGSVIDGSATPGLGFGGGVVLWEKVFLAGYASTSLKKSGYSLTVPNSPEDLDRGFGHLGVWAGYLHKLPNTPLTLRSSLKAGAGQLTFIEKMEGTADYKEDVWVLTPQVELLYHPLPRFALTAGAGYRMVKGDDAFGISGKDLSSPVLQVGIQVGR